MQTIILTGLQASGKSSFYRQRFFNTHIRINLDMLRTRKREATLLRACLEARQPFVVDNTNPTAAERARYIQPARDAGFSLVGYYFLPDPTACLARNASRPAEERVPPQAIWATLKKLQPPSLSEGFDALYSVLVAPGGQFLVEAWAGG
jgi:predicted kinase